MAAKIWKGAGHGTLLCRSLREYGCVMDEVRHGYATLRSMSFYLFRIAIAVAVVEVVVVGT